MLIVVTALMPLTVFADPDDPDGISILAFYVNRNLIETGDWLIYIRYNVDYTIAGIPDDPIDENYFFKLMNGAVELGYILPYPYNDKGYNVGIASWYFDAATVTTLGLIWNTEYTIRIDQNPARFITTPITYPFTLPSSAYTALTTTEDNRVQLSERIIAQAGILENEWGLTLLSEQDTGTVLASAGETYFRNAIKGSQVMAPDAFFLQSVEIDTSARVWGTDLSDDYKARFWGADGIEGTPDDSWIWTWGVVPSSDLLNIPSLLLIGIVILALCVVMIWQSQKRFKTAVPGYIASLIVVMGGGMLALGFTVVALIALAITLAGSWYAFMRKA